MRTALLICLITLAQSNPGDTLTGRVLGPDGQALVGAVVRTQHFFKGGGYDGREATTAPDGTFSLPSGGRVVFVRKSGFVPFTYMLRSREDALQLTLQPLGPDSIFNLPTCSEKYHVADEDLVRGKHVPAGIRLFGFSHLLPVPVKTKVKDYHDVDYGVHVISFPRNKKEHMITHDGPLWGAYYPFVDLLKNVTHVQERALSTGEDSEEMRGVLSNGHKFRWIGGRFDDAYYYDVSSEAANFFDHIIDQMCFSDSR
jgi:hypothetical protein